MKDGRKFLSYFGPKYVRENTGSNFALQLSQTIAYCRLKKQIPDLNQKLSVPLSCAYDIVVYQVLFFAAADPSP